MKLPPKWALQSLDDLVHELEAGVSVNGEDEPARPPEAGVLKVSAVSEGRFIPSENKRILGRDISRAATRPRKGSILVSRSNTPSLVGDSALVTSEHGHLFLPDKLWQIVLKHPDQVATAWLAQVLQTQRVRTHLIRLATGTSDSMKNISKPAFLSLEIACPTFPEQQKIAAILGTWDEALEKLDALLAAKQRRKQALMQQLLSGKRRLPKTSGVWQRRRLGSLLEPITRPVPKPNASFLAAGVRSHGRGIFLKRDFEPKDIALEELYEIRTDDLVVNITFAWEGAVAIVPPEANGALVSHRFPAFRVNEAESCLSFLRHYILTKRFVFDCGLASPGGAGRNRVLSKTAFLDIELAVPPVAEQRRIGDILDAADAELRLLRRQRDALDQQKRGLMQQLLTGRLRVKPA
ncbi:MAG: restriction endonuclease subunit S [Candidatus Didemnitutus sp.]|nr:restriction endonuclease subunit S [Candidatus Didemnitutus sp.]